MMRDRLGRILEKQKRFAQNLWESPAVILNYHRVAKPEVDPHGLAISPEAFRQQLRLIKAQFRPLAVDEFVEIKKQGRAFPKRSVLLTFDDGYVDNFTHALPALEEEGLECIFHISTERIDTDREFWWDRLSRVLLSASAPSGEFSITIAGRRRDFTLSSAEERCKAHDALYSEIKVQSPELRETMIDELCDRTNQPRSSVGDSRSMSSDEIRAMAKSRSARIGGHAHTHTPLAFLAQEKAKLEINQSIDILETIISRRVAFFSYPHGGRGEYTRTHIQLCAEKGLDAAFSNTYGQVHSWTDSCDIPRISVGNWPGELFGSRMQRYFWV